MFVLVTVFACPMTEYSSRKYVPDSFLPVQTACKQKRTSNTNIFELLFKMVVFVCRCR